MIDGGNLEKAYYKKHPKTYKGKKRGPKPMRLNERYIPEVLCKGNTHAELLTRSRFLLMKSRDKWSESQKKRGELLFELYPKIEEACNLFNSLRCVFRDKKLDKDSARKKLLNFSTNASAESLNAKIKSFRAQLHGVSDLPFFIYRGVHLWLVLPRNYAAPKNMNFESLVNHVNIKL